MHERDSMSKIRKLKPYMPENCFNFVGTTKGRSGTFKNDVRSILESLIFKIEVLEKISKSQDKTEIWGSIDILIDNLMAAAIEAKRPDFRSICDALREVFADIISQDTKISVSFWKILRESLSEIADLSVRRIVLQEEISQLISKIKKEIPNSPEKKHNQVSSKNNRGNNKQEKTVKQKSIPEYRSKKPLVFTGLAVMGALGFTVLFYNGVPGKKGNIDQIPEIVVSQSKFSSGLISNVEENDVAKPEEELESRHDANLEESLEPVPALEVAFIRDHRAALELQPTEAIKQYAIILHGKISSERKKKAWKKLSQIKEDLDRIYNELDVFSLAANGVFLDNAIGGCRQRWEEIGNVLLDTPSEAGFRKVLALNEDLMTKNDNLIAQLEDNFDSNSYPAVNIARKMNLLVTNLTCDYIAVSLNIDRQRHLDLMLTRASQFEQSIQDLENDSDTNARIKGLISSICKMEWRALQKFVNECSDNDEIKFKELMVVVFSDIVVEKTERLTIFYEEIQTELSLK